VSAVRRLAAADLAPVRRIVCDLPDYFTSDVPDQVERDAADHEGWVLTDSGAVAGFAVVTRRSPGGAEILWMAAGGVSVVEVKTLDRSADYQPYLATRAFWERRGFVYLDMIDPLPGWGPGNPAAIYVAALRPTR
jgi:hypothetical protein